MDRRTFLRRAGLTAGGAAAGAAGGLGVGWAHEHFDVAISGHAVGAERPPGPLDTLTMMYRAPIATQLVALTFDDGPSVEYTSRVLRELDRADATATFFVMGQHAAAHPELVRAAAERHEIGNHTWNHPDLGLARSADAAQQLRSAHTAITTAIGREPTLFRPPYGRFSGATAMMATSMGYQLILWDCRFDINKSAPTNVRDIGEQAIAGSIILLHDCGPSSGDSVVAAIGGIVAALRDRGLEPVTVSALLDQTAIEAADSVANRLAGGGH